MISRYSPSPFGVPYWGPFVEVCGRKEIAESLRISIGVMGIEWSLFLKIFVCLGVMWAEFNEMKWYSIWCVEL